MRQLGMMLLAAWFFSASAASAATLLCTPGGAPHAAAELVRTKLQAEDGDQIVTSAAGDDLLPFISPYLTKDFTTQDAMLSYFFSMDAEQRATAIITNDNGRGIPYLVIHRARAGQFDIGSHYATWTMYPYPGHVAGAASYMTMGFIVVATGNPELPFAVVVHRRYFGAETRVISDASLETRW